MTEHQIAQPITAHYIRYYTQYFHPKTFRGMGILGVAIRFLNWVRYWVETIVQRMVLSALVRSAKRDGVEFPRSKARATVRRFWEDVDREDAYIRGEVSDEEAVEDLRIRHGVDPKSFRYLFGKSTTSHQDAAPEDTNVPVVEGEEPEEGPKRPRPLDQMMSRYSAPPKERRYALGGQRVVLEDEIEAVPTTEAQHTRARILVQEGRMRPSVAIPPTPPPPLSETKFSPPAKSPWSDLIQATKRVPNPGPTTKGNEKT